VQNGGLQSDHVSQGRIEERKTSSVRLAFVPPHEFPTYFDHFLRDLPQHLLDLVRYTEKTGIRGRTERGRGRVAPLRYPPDLWKTSHTAQLGEPRIATLTEDWHNRFKNMTRKHHPSFCHQIPEIFKEQCNKKHTIIETCNHRG
jgi:hypothetical protein